LNTTGPGDAFMSTEFQQTLRGNILLRGNQPINYNDTIILKHKNTNAYLHSHAQKYPREYDDGRISSGGQQVTGYFHQDVNNHWKIIPLPSSISHYFSTSNSSRPENDFIKHKDYIILEHVNTNTLLLTHEVASPLTSTNQEFT